jgi:hypothetical protein
MRNWKSWIKCAGIRALKTVAQAAVSMIGVGAAMSDVDWLRVASVSLLAGILSLLTSLAGLPEEKEVVKPEVTDYKGG